MTFQVLDYHEYSEKDMKKSIKVKMNLSDGNSKMTCLVVQKVFDVFAFAPKNFDVIQVPVAKTTITSVNNKLVMVLKSPPQLLQTDLQGPIGAANDYHLNVEQDNFEKSTDIRIPGKEQPPEEPSVNDVPDSHMEESDGYMPIKAIN